MSNETETKELFNVVVFYPDDSYTYERRGVSAHEAVIAAKSFTERPAAQLGMIRRVIITDSGDCCNFEWRHGEGVTFPPRGGSAAPESEKSA